MKMSSIRDGVIGFLISASLFTACGHAGLKVRVYFSRPDLGGVYRAQDKELVPYSNTYGFRCMNAKDFDAVIQTLKACQVSQ